MTKKDIISSKIVGKSKRQMKLNSVMKLVEWVWVMGIKKIGREIGWKKC